MLLFTLSRCRVFVAPLRFGAGMKGKVGQSMSHGLPIVATKIGAEGMGLRHETEILIADGPQDFANSVNRLYSDEILWRKLSHNGLAHVEANYSLVTSRKRMAHYFSQKHKANQFFQRMNGRKVVIPRIELIQRYR